MIASFSSLLAQVDPKKLDPETPFIGTPGSSSLTWIIIAVIVVGILLIAFKQAKRNIRE